jgi:hypothetical protein
MMQRPAMWSLLCRRIPFLDIVVGSFDRYLTAKPRHRYDKASRTHFLFEAADAVKAPDDNHPLAG